jgi:Holliday junction resolvase
MSKNKNKDKGTRWERDAAKELNKEFPDTWRRIPMSGAAGTQLGIPMLQADLMGDYSFLDHLFMGEAKVGYGGKSMTIQKEWFDKIAEASDKTHSYPVVLLKFENSRSGVRHVIAMDFEIWDKLLKEIQEMYLELESLYEKRDEH